MAAIAASMPDVIFFPHSALSQVTSETSYNVSCAILDKQPIIVSQLRRTNKLLNTNVKVQQFTFK